MTTATNHLLSVPNNTHRNWWKDKSLRQNLLHCAGCCLCVFYLGFDQALLASLQALPIFNVYFNTPTGTTLGLIASSLYFPGLFASFFGSWVSMKYGRKPTVWIGSGLIIVGTFVNALATNTGIFCGGRVLIGAGGAITKVAAPALLNEIAHPRIRSVIAASYYGWFFLGSALSSWLCLAGLYIPNDWSWRMPCMFQLFAPTLVIIITATGPESPRFLINKGRNEEALNMLAKYHANGKVDDELVQLEYGEICAALESEGEEHKSSWLDLIRTKGNRRRIAMSILMACGTNWTGSGLLGYYLTPILASVGITDPKQTTSLNGGLALFNLLACQLAATQADRISRRVSFFTSGVGMISFASGKKEFGIPTVPIIFAYFAFYDIAWMALPFHYCTEIMPFHLRTKGLAVFTAVQTFANGFNQFVNPIAFKAIAWRFYIVYIAINAGYMVYFYFYLIDSRGMSLESTTLLFDFPRREARQRADEGMQARVAARAEARAAALEKEKGEIDMVEDVAALDKTAPKSMV
ncbi:uncharacterized protein COLE_07292 [Cutaneotrichosporon oleaginosum]|uniref:uncharacterized protein n=1 Tax=Cutaneotrichosporon oleaginosum TaxID=879819 RepID=UPI00132B7903|nr:hypothetical protein COLE_07292 [Cutaneotrichosporon oleaginosum]